MPDHRPLLNVPAAIVAEASARGDLEGLRRDAEGDRPFALVALPKHAELAAGATLAERYATVEEARAALAAGRQDDDPRLFGAMVVDLRTCLPLLAPGDSGTQA